MNDRRLRLRRETLAPLAPDQLRAAVAAYDFTPACPATLQGMECWNDISFERCPEPVTLPIEECL